MSKSVAERYEDPVIKVSLRSEFFCLRKLSSILIALANAHPKEIIKSSLSLSWVIYFTKKVTISGPISLITLKKALLHTFGIGREKWGAGWGKYKVF